MNTSIVNTVEISLLNITKSVSYSSCELILKKHEPNIT